MESEPITLTLSIDGGVTLLLEAISWTRSLETKRYIPSPAEILLGANPREHKIVAGRPSITGAFVFTGPVDRFVDFETNHELRVIGTNREGKKAELFLKGVWLSPGSSRVQEDGTILHEHAFTAEEVTQWRPVDS